MEQMQAARRIGLLGGTFDPIHYGHLVIAEEVRVALHLTEVVFIPTGQPPHKRERQVTAARHRLAMVRLALASNPYFSLSEIEIEREGPSYTVETLRLLRQRWGSAVYLAFIVGADSLAELSTWYDVAGILEQLNALVAVGRPGYQQPDAYLAVLERQLPGLGERLCFVDAPSLSIAASDLRRRVAEGRPIKYQTPEPVETYIVEHGLYRQPSAAEEPGGSRMPMHLEIGDRLRLRKPHPCGGYTWRVVRLGADIGLRCETCGHRVLLPRSEVERRVKERLPRAVDEEDPDALL